MTRVMLAEWEWACCGEPFAVGDEVDFGVASRGPDEWLAAALGAELAATVDAVESHHEEDFPDRVRGRVTAVHAVTREHLERRILRRPGHGAPLDAQVPAEGEEWPSTGRELLGGIWVGSRPTRYTIECAPAPATARLQPVAGVRHSLEGAGTPPSARADAGSPVADPPPERRTRRTMGWLVDVDEDGVGES